MSDHKLFPNIKRVLRNAISVGIIAAVANYQNIYPPTAEIIYSIGIGFAIAFAIEFAHAYKTQPKPKGRKQGVTTFFAP